MGDTYLLQISGEQTRLRNLIESLQIPSEWIDITTDVLVREKMREECGKPTAMPPQIFNEFRYLGVSQISNGRGVAPDKINGGEITTNQRLQILR